MNKREGQREKWWSTEKIALKGGKGPTLSYLISLTLRFNLRPVHFKDKS